MITKVKIPHTCGEWLQGTLSGKDLLISCPMGNHSEVTVELQSISHKNKTSQNNISIVEGEKTVQLNKVGQKAKGTHSYKTIHRYKPWKAIKAVELSFTKLGLPPMKVNIAIHSTLPQGKGYGTSSADIYGSILGVCSQTLSGDYSRLAAQIAVQVEPSDSTCFSGLSQMNHINGEDIKILGTSPPGYVAVLDLGGKVDTEEFNGNNDLGKLNLLKEPELHKAYEQFLKGVEKQDLSKMAAASTLSAKLHQHVIYRSEIDRLINSYKKAGSLGIVRAHSGTVVGLVYSEDMNYRELFWNWYQDHSIGKFIDFYPLTNGGFRRC